MATPQALRQVSPACCRQAVSLLALRPLASTSSRHAPQPAGGGQQQKSQEQQQQQQVAAAQQEPPPQPSASARQPTHQNPPPHHWLDQWFPRLRPWLDSKNRQWWLHGLLKARPREFHQLQGREELLRSAVEAELQRLLQRHAHRAVDARAETHLQVAALALATHRALLPFLRDERQVLEIISEHMGVKSQPVLTTLLKLTRWLHRDGFSTLAGRLRGLQLDYGGAFRTQLERSERSTSLTVTACFYRDLFEEESVPALTACCCCTQDKVWLETVHYPGVRAGLISSMAAGDAACCFRVEQEG